MVNTILANVGTIVCFRSGSPEDEQFMLPFFAPYVKEGEIAYLPSYNFYARLSAFTPQEPVSGQTLLIQEQASIEIAKAVIESSRANFAKKHTGGDAPSVIQSSPPKAKDKKATTDKTKSGRPGRLSTSASSEQA
jgi:hypothetical protein